MAQCLAQYVLGWSRVTVIGLAWLVPLITSEAARGQPLRGPDLGVWFSRQRGAGGVSELIVADLDDGGPFAAAGLREGDRIVSVHRRPIDRETQFVQAVMALAVSERAISVVIQRSGRQQTLAVKPQAVMQGIASSDPLYQAGLALDERNPTLMIVLRVFPCTPAFYAGLRQADVIASVDGKPVTSLAGLTEALQRGGNLNLAVTRNNQTRQMTLTLEANRSDRAVLAALGQGGPTRRITTAGALAPNATQPPPPLAPFQGPSVAPLLAPPSIPNLQPAIPSPPPAIPSLPPPGTVLNL